MYELMINVNEMQDDAAVIRFGLAIARPLHAFVTGLHIVAEHPSVAAIPEAIALMEAEEASAWERDAWWKDLCHRAGVEGAWDVLRGLYVPLLSARSGMADLLVDSLPGGHQGMPVGLDDVTRTLFAGGAPMLLVPPACTLTEAPQRVLLAWNGSAEALQAIRAALPLLRQAGLVHLLDGQRERTHDFELKPLPLREWLDRQGVTVQQRQVFHPSRLDAGPRLLEEAEAMHADLLVMGAWGRTRLSELVLGGTTHHVLTHARQPLLMAR
jgi:nucleotide-binding universal stress UspA family protein